MLAAAFAVVAEIVEDVEMVAEMFAVVEQHFVVAVAGFVEIDVVERIAHLMVADVDLVAVVQTKWMYFGLGWMDLSRDFPLK